jgi:hypothetical protein
LPFFLAALALAPRVARAGDPVAAEALFRAGRAAVQRGDHRAACARFAESQRLEPAAGTLINLGDCKAKLGLWAASFQHYQEALDRLGEDTRVPLVREKMKGVAPHVSRLEIELAPGAPTGLAVLRDGESVGAASLGLALPVESGTHVVEVRAPGYAPRRFEVTLGDGESRVLVAEPGPRLLVAASPAAPSRGLRNAGIAVVGVSVASFAVSAATGFLTLARKKTVTALCPHQACDAEGLAAASQGKAFSAASTVTFFAGLAALGAGVGMVVAGSRSSPTAILAPSASAAGAGLGLHGTF